MQLSELKPGTYAKISDLSQIDRVIRRRLMDLGITVGEKICYKSSMPFGGPCMFESCGECIGIRRSEADCILVECE
ncbi:ferrous iron transport protein A [Sporolactobacillus shoreae]|uniref:Ferrous iron transport protein A n=1 Tax=Sporolactobacillus shoreae TaxID=1465501 RepID=A0A4Z0GJT5_9BACL|nr:FeoA family protein [Sporolactobacillus shoreae]TGA96176.1 ferrous iron transport protein A [Sporolactobacillus shoreae]